MSSVMITSSISDIKVPGISCKQLLVTVELEGGYRYEVYSLDRWPSHIHVQWTRKGWKSPLQKMSKTFFDWESVAANYRKLAPHIAEVRAEMEALMLRAAVVGWVESRRTADNLSR